MVQPIWKERITLTRSILNKIGREFIRFLRPDFYGEREKLWMEREEISHFEEIFFFFLLMGERSLETDDGNYIIGSERAVGAGG